MFLFTEIFIWCFIGWISENFEIEDINRKFRVEHNQKVFYLRIIICTT